MSTPSLIQKAFARPLAIPEAALRRIFPRHRRFGYQWVHLADGSVTFREEGFVAASSPAALLARHNYEAQLVRTLLAKRATETSLEIGCGFGRLSPIIAESSRKHFAIDINPEALSLAKSAYPSIDFRLGSALALPFSDDSFDLIVTWTVLQHIPPDAIAQAVSEMKRVLRPSGCVLCCEETRLAGRPIARGAHTWHRSIAEYAELFGPLCLGFNQEFVELDAIPGLGSPGRVMMWLPPEVA